MIDSAREAFRSGDFRRAEQISAELLAGNPHNVDALEVQSLVQTQRGDDTAAEHTLRKAIAAAPSRRWHYGDLARLLLRLGRDEEAESVARSALSADARNADAHAILGSLLIDPRPVEAARHFSDAIALVGEHPSC